MIIFLICQYDLSLKWNRIRDQIHVERGSSFPHTSWGNVVEGWPGPRTKRRHNTQPIPDINIWRCGVHYLCLVCFVLFFQMTIKSENPEDSQKTLWSLHLVGVTIVHKIYINFLVMSSWFTYVYNVLWKLRLLLLSWCLCGHFAGMEWRAKGWVRRSVLGFRGK